MLALALMPPPPNFSPGAWAKAAWLYQFGDSALPSNRAIAAHWGDSEDTIGRELKRFIADGLIYEHRSKRFANQARFAAFVDTRKLRPADPQISERLARASGSSSTTTTPPEITNAEEAFLTQLRNGMRHEHEVRLPKSTWPVVAEYVRRIEAKGERPGEILHSAGARAADNGATTWAYVKTILDGWGYGPFGSDVARVREVAEDDDVETDHAPTPIEEGWRMRYGGAS